MADRFGRKRTMILGVLLVLFSGIMNWFAFGFWQFAFQFILTAASFSMFSGTEEAMLYDTLKELKREEEMTHFNGRMSGTKHIFKIFIPAIGAFVAKDLLESQFRILIGVNILVGLIAFYFVARLVEPRHVKSVEKLEKGIFKDSLNAIKADSFLIRAALNSSLVFIVNFITWRLYQPILVNYGVSVLWIGIFYILMQGAIFTNYWYLGYLEKRFGSAWIINGSLVGIILSFLALIFLHTVWILYIAMMLVMILDTLRAPVFSHGINKRIPSHSRATTLSNLNVIRGFLNVPILLITAWLSTDSSQSVFIFCLIISVAVLIALPMRERELKNVTIGVE